MKDLSLFISIATLVILFGYITYSGLQEPLGGDLISDEAVALEEENVEEDSQAFAAVSINLPHEASFAGEPAPLAMPDVMERLAASGAQDGGGSTEKFGDFMLAEQIKWAKIIKDGGVKGES